MPNHCENDLVITGKDEDLQKMLDECFEEVDEDAVDGDEIMPCLSFDKVIPYPKEWKKMDKAAEKARAKWEKTPKEKRGEYPAIKDGFNSGGYDWCIKNWGTKWSPYSVYGFSKQEGEVRVSFSTAWSPPNPVIVALAKKFPELKINLRSYEHGMGFKCHVIAEEGEVVSETTSNYRGPRGG